MTSALITLLLTSAGVFASTFLTVFALGIQSLNVNQRMYGAAAVTSLAISSGHLWLYKVMPNPGLLDYLGYYAGGVVGITVGIWAHPHIKAWLQRFKRPAVDEHVTQHFPACDACGNAAGRSCGRLLCERYDTKTLH